MRTHTTPRATIAQTRSNSYISTWFVMSSFATSQLSAIFWEKSQNYTIASCIHEKNLWTRMRRKCGFHVAPRIICGRILIGHTTRNLISGLCPWGRVLIEHATRKLIGGLCPWGASFKISFYIHNIPSGQFPVSNCNFNGHVALHAHVNSVTPDLW